MTTKTNALRVKGYRSGDTISDEYKTNYLARMLAGYDDATWERLKADRKQTYQRAAANLLHDGTIVAHIEEWKTIERQRRARLEKQQQDSEPAMRAAIAKAKKEIYDNHKD